MKTNGLTLRQYNTHTLSQNSPTQSHSTLSPHPPKATTVLTQHPSYSTLTDLDPPSFETFVPRDLPRMGLSLSPQVTKARPSALPKSRSVAPAKHDPTLPGAFPISSHTRSDRLFSMNKLEIPESQRPLFVALNEVVRDYMYQSHYDPSHDYEHIQRVVAWTHKLYVAERNLEASLPTSSEKDTASTSLSPRVDVMTMYLGAMMHDVGEPKYHNGIDQGVVIKELMMKHGASEDVARDVATLAVNVSFTQENTATDKTLLESVLEKHPELAFVQDADRLDAIGVVGMGRCFEYGGANATRRTQTLHMAVQLMDLRFQHYLDKFKTRAGKVAAEEKWEEMLRFREQWHKESDVSSVL